MNKKYIFIGLAVLVFVGLLAWLFIESSKPPPGEKAMQDGQDHVSVAKKVEYKFNPPTSGDHYGSWITKGFYNEPRMDENLVHSLEHGYVIFWYDCQKKVQSYHPNIISDVYAQRANMTASSEGSPSASLESMPEAFRNGSCEGLKEQIKAVMDENGLHKLIAVPKVRMDHPLILTAWGRMLKLDFVDKNQINKFINSFRDAGPESTSEP